MRPFDNKILRVVALVLRILLGAFFVVSAVAKMVDIDRFEIYIFSFNVLPLGVSFVMARLVIIAELLVGIGLMANVFKRIVDVCTLLLLVAFTLFLGYAALIGRTDSCQCMGSLLEIDPIRSIFKNAILLLLLVVAMGAQSWAWRPRWFVWLPVVVGVVVAIFVLSCPDNWLFGASEEVYNQEELDKAIAPGGDFAPLSLQEGRYVVAFLTPGCPFCRMADEKLTHICRRNDLDSARIVYFSPADSTVAPLTIDTSNFIRPYYQIPLMTYALITYGQRPMVFLLEDGEVKATCHYRNIDERQIVRFLQP